MMKKFALILCIMLLLTVASMAAERVSPVLLKTDKPVLPALNPPEVPIAPLRLPAGELDEYFGDTVNVGFTFQDVQHNATVGRTIAFDPNGNDGNGAAPVTFTQLYEPSGVSRHVVFSRIVFNDDMPAVQPEGLYQVDAGDRAGFSVLAMSQTGDSRVPVPVYHGRMGPTASWDTKVAAEYPFFPGLFVEYAVPWTPEDYQIIWPKAAMDGDSIIHVLSTSSGADTYENWYSRLHFDPDNTMFEITNPGDYPELVTDRGEFISGNIATSNDGQRVAVATLINRARLLGEEDPWWLDQDLYLWLNEDRGQNWDWDLETGAWNITDFIDPDPDLMPDWVAASADTFRCYMDVDLYFDDEDILHAAFSTLQFFYFGGDDNTGVAYVTGQIWYWNEIDQVFVRIADGDFWNNTALGVNSITVQRPSLYKDPESGWMYCLYQQFGVPGDTLGPEDTDDESMWGIGRDRSEAGYLNTEQFITASPPWGNPGKLWIKGVNITNTRGVSGMIPAGENRTERDASIALNNDGDYLNIFYQLDLDPGVYLYSTPEGVATDNPMVYQRISKADLQDSLLAQAEWVRGIPLHVDETAFWEDPNDWEWFVNDVGDQRSNIPPGHFELNDVYPNPFNSTTKISFNLQDAGFVTLKVYDTLGREVSTLLKRNMRAGQHFISLDASDLASGIYFVTLQSGANSVTRKIALVR